MRLRNGIYDVSSKCIVGYINGYRVCFAVSLGKMEAILVAVCD